MLCFSGLMMAQDAQQEVKQEYPDSIKGVHPYKLEENEHIVPEITHWSIIPHIGFSIFDGDYTSELDHAVAVPTLGLGVQYNFTPVWSIGAEYMYDMYTVTGKQGEGLTNADTLLTGHMHKAGAYLAMDLIHLLFPRANKAIFSLHPYVGGGAAWYKRTKYYQDDRYYNAEKGLWINPTHERGNTANYINKDGVVGPEHDDDYRATGYMQAGVNAEFNLNRTLAMGLRVNYSYFTRDYVDGRGYHKMSSASYASKNNDGIFDVTLNMRFKLYAVEESHPRNMPSFETFDKMLAKNAPKDEPACVHDTVIIYHDTIIIREKERERIEKKAPIQIFNVYFDNDKANLRNDALITIQEAATFMEENPDLYAVLIGYCDNTGSKAHNYELGDRRAVNVMEELQEEYGIPADHMFNAGMGKIAARKTAKSFSPNRRVSIHMVDEETFELMKIELQSKSEDRNMDENEPVTYENSRAVRMPKMEELKTVPLSESGQKEEVNEFLDRKADTITVEKGMTLSKLARKYYNNAQCWVYIYMANTDKMSTPDHFQEGMQLVIPELTEEEMQITVKDCLRLYSTTARKQKKTKQ